MTCEGFWNCKCFKTPGFISWMNRKLELPVRFLLVTSWLKTWLVLKDSLVPKWLKIFFLRELSVPGEGLEIMTRSRCLEIKISPEAPVVVLSHTWQSSPVLICMWTCECFQACAPHLPLSLLSPLSSPALYPPPLHPFAATHKVKGLLVLIWGPLCGSLAVGPTLLPSVQLACSSAFSVKPSGDAAGEWIRFPLWWRKAAVLSKTICLRVERRLMSESGEPLDSPDLSLIPPWVEARTVSPASSSSH